MIPLSQLAEQIIERHYEITEGRQRPRATVVWANHTHIHFVCMWYHELSVDELRVAQREVGFDFERHGGPSEVRSEVVETNALVLHSWNCLK